jgi:hypothetical protein
MQRLYSASGASQIEILDERYGADEWAQLRGTVQQLLGRRKQDGAIKLLDRFDWKVVEATNDFADEFGILYAQVPLPLYADNGHLASSAAARQAAKVLADTLTEVVPNRPYIRHVVYVIDTSAPTLVSAPVPQFTSRAVLLALADADHLLEAGSAVSAVDRVHTALMGHLRLLCDRHSLPFAETDGAATLIKKLFKANEQVGSAAHSEHMLKILRSAGAMLDAFEPLRNRGSMAHANAELLDEREAMLVVNIARSLFHYLDTKVFS